MKNFFSFIFAPIQVFIDKTVLTLGAKQVMLEREQAYIAGYLQSVKIIEYFTTEQGDGKEFDEDKAREFLEATFLSGLDDVKNGIHWQSDQ